MPKRKARRSSMDRIACARCGRVIFKGEYYLRVHTKRGPAVQHLRCPPEQAA